MVISDLYILLQRRRLTGSMRHCSDTWLGKPHNYVSLNQDDEAPAEVLLTARARLLKAGYPDLAAALLLAALGVCRCGARAG